MSEQADQVRVSTKVRLRPDRAGDPLDGLVNLFDLGIVLAVAFLLAALSSLQLSDLLTSKNVSVTRQNGQSQTVITKKDNQIETISPTKQKVVGQGTPIGTVYRLDDGRDIVVPNSGSSTGSGTTTPPEGETPPATGNSSTTPGTTTTPSIPGLPGSDSSTPSDGTSGGTTNGLPNSLFGN